MTSPAALLRGVLHPKRRGGLSTLMARPSPELGSVVGDGRLMYQIASGEVGALAELFDRYGAACWKVGKQVVADDHAAEEAVCAAFLDIWLHTPQLADAQAQQRLVALTYQHALAVRTLRAVEQPGEGLAGHVLSKAPRAS